MGSPKIAVLGTGANGASIGADMIRAGLDVTFIDQWQPTLRRCGKTASASRWQTKR
jgi:3-hydroxyisobutyrate dehydrogenase-like beta-hydroxyacid dehydrogenase